MGRKDRLQQLRATLRELSHLGAAIALLGWDEQTYMPPGAAEARGAQGATLERLAHETFTRPQVGEWLAELEDGLKGADPDSFEASLVRVTRREYDKAVRVPAALVEQLAQATSQSFHAWVEARRSSRFADFRPHLERVLQLTAAKADHLGWKGERYDALLDQYEPEVTAPEVEALFAQLRPGLVALLERIRARGEQVDPELLRGDYPEPAQEELCRRVLQAVGFDLQRGRVDRSAHPFTTTIGAASDVRLTTRYDPADFPPALYGAIHEGGHGMYEQGIPAELADTPLGGGASLGVHESQSRLWENLVGRSLGFCRFLLPLARELFPEQLGGVDPTSLFRAVNRVRPSLIRVEADEVTYNLHIILRFDLERRLIRGELAAADLPEAWNEAMARDVGIRPGNDAEGVLQDVHWAHGLIGYFPTYALGNLLAATLWQTAPAGVEEGFARGEFRPLLDWLRAEVHVHGAKYTPKELVRRVTGRPLSAEPFLAYVNRKYAQVYGL